MGPKEQENPASSKVFYVVEEGRNWMKKKNSTPESTNYCSDFGKERQKESILETQEGREG